MCPRRLFASSRQAASRAGRHAADQEMDRIEGIKQIFVPVPPPLAGIVPQGKAGQGRGNIHGADGAAQEHPHPLPLSDKIVGGRQKHCAQAEGAPQHSAPQHRRQDDDSLGHPDRRALASGVEPQAVEHDQADGQGKQGILAVEAPKTAAHSQVIGDLADDREAQHGQQVPLEAGGVLKALYQQESEHRHRQPSDHLEDSRPGGQAHQARVGGHRPAERLDGVVLSDPEQSDLEH